MGQPKRQPWRQRVKQPFSVMIEAQRVGGAWLRYTSLRIPAGLFNSALRSWPRRTDATDTPFLDAFSDAVLKLFEDLGPLYGKAGQVAISRLSPQLHRYAEHLRLTRLYGDWPPLPFASITAILNSEIPDWQQELTIDPTPIGVASMAQVHAARDQAGNEWVIKVIKPQARQRLTESLAAIEQVIAILKPFALTAIAKRGIGEMQELCAGFRRELDLAAEAETIERVAAVLREHRGQKTLRIPVVHQTLSNANVLVMERFAGVRLSDVVAGKVRLSPAMQKRLARNILKELLVQVFELGLFHGDPHAGNLILLEDGSVGLFDWGLAGELRDADRTHIAGMLKAVLAVDIEKLIDVLVLMAEEGGKKVRRAKIKKELRKVIAMVKAGQEDATKKPSLQMLIDHCLRVAQKLAIPIPPGLLLMAKSLITIEGLARGIDPQVSMVRVATPVLFRAAKPSIGEMFQFARKFPGLAKKVFFDGD